MFTVLLLLSSAISLAQPGAGGWHPASGPLMTRWAAQVNPTNALPEYPRPQLVRGEWLNLNGLWDYSVTSNAVSGVTTFDGKILVPFPIESALSGVMRRLDENSTLWYRRGFALPKAWKGSRIRLNFGAVDWQAQVFVNGKFVGQHRGGYDAFSFDITDCLNWTNAEEILIAVKDPTEGDQPRGKQTRKPEGIFYTPTSGIWQTVWLEPVPQTSVDELTLTPDVDAGCLRVRVGVAGASELLRVEVTALSSNAEVARVSGSPNKEIVLPLARPHLWSPDDPFLYDLRVTLTEGARIFDSITSYFGMRKVALGKDAGGVMRIEINGRFLFESGVLDQGFWPDGIYTAPTDEALRFDIEFLKRGGFNLARKHVKVEPDRWYYWCDRLGLIVWQDMPSGNNSTAEGRKQFEIELQRMIEGRRNHPSILMWVLFNEGWGQYDTERIAPWIKSFDPSRLVSNASGWTDKRVGDVIDMHSYPGPESPQPQADRAAVLGEFGGLGLGVSNHTWAAKIWGYQIMPDAKTLGERYTESVKGVHLLRDWYGLSAAVYTQATDVETECNGLMTYDRAISKIDAATLLALNEGDAGETRFSVVVPNALFGRIIWKYTNDKPGEQWFRPDFDDSAWKEGVAGFGTKGTPGALANTTWNTSDIWLRRQFYLRSEDLQNAMLQIHHDEDAEVYFNGILAARIAGFTTIYEQAKISPEALAALKQGENSMAIHCHQSTGGQYIDAGIILPRSDKAAETKK